MSEADHDAMVEVIRAHKRGDKIQAREKDHAALGWRECPFPNFDFYRVDFRVAPVPREWWGEVLPSGGLFINDSPQNITKGGELIRVREVIQ